MAAVIRRPIRFVSGDVHASGGAPSAMEEWNFPAPRRYGPVTILDHPLDLHRRHPGAAVAHALQNGLLFYTVRAFASPTAHRWYTASGASA